jgi:Fe2+ transport system protein B
MTTSTETAEHPPQWAALAGVTAALAMFGAALGACIGAVIAIEQETNPTVWGTLGAITGCALAASMWTAVAPAWDSLFGGNRATTS